MGVAPPLTRRPTQFEACRMISVVLPTHNNARTLGLTLAALVPAALDGLVKQVIVVDAGSTDATLEVAEDAGCRVVTGPADKGLRLAAGCAVARQPWLLIVDPAPEPPEAWRGVVESFLKRGEGRAAWLPQPGPSGLAALLRPPGLWGLLVSREAYEATGGFTAGASPERRLMRRLKGPRRLRY
jgi:glycosyltransferase involved in cell wall biosynthesis